MKAPTSPRIEPLQNVDATPAQLEQLERAAINGEVFNIFRTLAHHPDLLRRWLVFGGHVLSKSTLAPREREMVILRIGWLCASEYEWGQHVIIGRRSGLSEEEIRGITLGPSSPLWRAADRVLLRATDELHETKCIGDETWRELSAQLSIQQILDLVFCAGQYTLVSMALRTFGVQRDAGVPSFEETAGRRPEGA